MNPFDFAIEMTRDGEKFFQALTARVKKPGLRKILTMLADDQAAHRRGFEEMKKREGVSLPDARELGGVLNPFAERLKRLSRGAIVHEDLLPADLYRRGQELDRECEGFYRERAARVKHPRLKEAFLKVAEEQRKHSLSLEHLITYITDPLQNLEDAEWHLPESPEWLPPPPWRKTARPGV